MTFNYANVPDEGIAAPSPLPAEFTLSAPPGTDIWRKPPKHDIFNAPILYRSFPLSTFLRARITVSADWKTLYDQGGLCLVLPQSQGVTKWVKTGIEFYNGSAYVGIVACDRSADWSLLPITGNAVTVEMEREVVDGKATSSLWIYVLHGEERSSIREVTWVFDGVDDGTSGDCWIGAYAAKPTKDNDDGSAALQVSFKNMIINTF